MCIKEGSFMDYKRNIRGFMNKFFRKSDLRDDDDIFALGYVNSLFSMQLVLYIEKEFKLKLDNDDLNIAYFRSIISIDELINRKIIQMSARTSK